MENPYCHTWTLHYIPHHPVIKEERVPTKIRIVYDASTRISPHAPSLNDCLHVGPFWALLQRCLTHLDYLSHSQWKPKLCYKNCGNRRLAGTANCQRSLNLTGGHGLKSWKPSRLSKFPDHTCHQDAAQLICTFSEIPARRPTEQWHISGQNKKVVWKLLSLWLRARLLLWSHRPRLAWNFWHHW